MRLDAFDTILKTWRREGHELHPDDLEAVLEAAPEVLVVGTGKWGRVRVLPETEALLQQRGIRLVALRTEEACERYNALQAGGQRAAAALHLTC